MTTVQSNLTKGRIADRRRLVTSRSGEWTRPPRGVDPYGTGGHVPQYL